MSFTRDLISESYRAHQRKLDANPAYGVASVQFADPPPRLVPVSSLDHVRHLTSVDLPVAPQTRRVNRRGVARSSVAPAAGRQASVAALLRRIDQACEADHSNRNHGPMHGGAGGGLWHGWRRLGRRLYWTVDHAGGRRRVRSCLGGRGEVAQAQAKSR